MFKLFLLNILFLDGLCIHLPAKIRKTKNVKISLVRQANQTVFFVRGIRSRNKGNDGYFSHLTARVSRKFVLSIRPKIGQCENLTTNEGNN